MAGTPASGVSTKFESMFDLLDAEALRTADEASVVAAIADAARAEAAAASTRLAAIAELVRRRADGPVDRAYWSCDNWDAMAAEVAAAQGISHAKASGQMYLAVALRDRLPKVAALFAAGTISAPLVSAIVWHTALIKDSEALRLVDETLARDATRFGPLSVSKTAQAIEAIVDRHDPGALRRSRAAARGRHITISPADSDAGTAALWGSLLATDAAALDSRLTQLARQVCDDDPRTLDQRRADALGSLAAGGEHLACACGNAGCRAGVDPRAAAVVIHVVADAAAVEAQPDPHTSGERKSRPVTPEMTLAEALAPDPEPDVPAVRLPAAHLTGGGTLPASMVAELIRDGAKIQPLHHPADSLPEPGYRPSAQLERFIRCRDMTCRFPGCDRPAEFADIDHTIPYPLGPTHPSNLKCLCRKHHILKTFWSGWRDEQRPDGTIVWTSPSGRKYVTRPGSRLLFPALCLPTGELSSAPTTHPLSADRGLLMPKRRLTRLQERARRIDAERALNAARVAERNQPPPF